MARALVAVVGRANVGKSTLVNRLVGRRAAIEHPTPGVTRDRRGYEVAWAGTSFTVVDTGGWEPRAKGLTAKVAAQAQRAAAEADVILFVLDSRTGITDDDLAVAKGLRRQDTPVIVVANKVDSGSQERDAHALERLGLGEAVPVSALHGRGSGELLDLVVKTIAAAGPRDPQEDAGEDVRVAIVGRPNVGKSSLFNRLVADERSIVDDTPGTTRDTVDTVAEIEGRRYRFVDTAGMRRKAKRAEGPEYYGLVRSLQAVDEADVALLVIDAVERVTEQDQKIARRIADSGRAAAILLNKWDLVDAEEADDLARDTLDQLKFVAWAPLIRISAKTGRGVGKIVEAIESARAAWDQRVPTATLNVWLREAVERIPMKGPAGRPLKIRYATQTRSRPPEIALFTNGDVSAGAQRALERRLRERFGFEGTPIRFTVRRKQRP